MTSSPCHGVGTYDETTQSCSCPLTHAGRFCELFRQPACSLDAMRALRPRFWVKTITRERSTLHAPHLLSKADDPFGLGPLPCDCTRQLLQTTAMYRSIFALMPNWLLCAAMSSEKTNTVGSLLESGASAAQSWVNLSIFWGSHSRAYAFSEVRYHGQSANDAALAAFGETLLPLARCREACGGTAGALVGGLALSPRGAAATAFRRQCARCGVSVHRYSVRKHRKLLLACHLVLIRPPFGAWLLDGIWSGLPMEVN